MGQINSPISPWASSLAITEDEARMALGLLMMKSPSSSVIAEGGVMEGASPTATASGTTCTVTAHEAVVVAADGTPWGCSARTSLAVPLDTVPASGQSRYDIIVGEVVSGVYRLRSVTGPASSNPSIPTSYPANTVPLFRVQVTNSGAQTPVSVMSFTRSPGGIRLVETGDTRAGSYTGDLRKFRTGQIDVWTGSAWTPIVAPTSATTVAWTLQYAGGGSWAAGTVGIGSTGVGTVSWKINGKELWVDYNFSLSGTGFNGGVGDITTQLPGGFVAARGQWMPCQVFLNSEAGFNSAPANVSGAAYIEAGSSTLRPLFPAGVYPSLGIDPRQIGFRNTDTSTARQTGVPKVPNSFWSVAGSGLHIGPGTVQVQ